MRRVVAHSFQPAELVGDNTKAQPQDACLGRLESSRGGQSKSVTVELTALPVVDAIGRAHPWADPKDEVVTPIVILDLLPEESKGQNDVSQLPGSNGQSGKIRKETNSALPLQTVWEAV